MKRKGAVAFGILMAGALGDTIWCSRRFYPGFLTGREKSARRADFIGVSPDSR